MRLVSITMLQPEMVLAKAIYCNDRLLLNEGLKDITRYADSLKRLGIEYVYVEDEKSFEIEIPDAVSEQTRIACKHIVYETMTNFSYNLTVDISSFSDTISNLIDEILQNAEVQISLHDIGSADEYTFNHSVSTTVYALLLAIRMGYTRPMLEKLAVGTLLHDIGKILLDKEILLKESPLTKDEFEYIKQHTTLGYEALKKCVSMSELSRIISLYHHERIDATGYPTGAPAGSIHEFARIVTIADVYDALTSDRCYRKKWSANKAAEYLVQYSNSIFDVNLVSNFIQLIAIYPNGSMVLLSNDKIGIVKEQNRNMPLRPIVRVISDKNGKEIEMYEIDLMKELSITILESELEMELKH